MRKTSIRGIAPSFNERPGRGTSVVSYIVLSAAILCLCVVYIYFTTGGNANTQPDLHHNTSAPLLEIKLEGIWYDGNYYIVSFDLSQNAYQVNQYNSNLEFIKKKQGNSWDAICENLPPNFSFWDSGQSKLVTAQGEEAFSNVDCDKLIKLTAQGPYIFSSRDKNKLTVCSDPNDPTTYRSCNISGIVALKAINQNLVGIKVLEDHDNKILLWDTAKGESAEVVPGNYQMMVVGENVVLKPDLFVGKSENTVFLYYCSNQELELLPLDVSDLWNIRFSANGKYMVGYREGQIEVYDTNTWSLSKSVRPPKLQDTYDAYENDFIMTVSNDGSKVLLFDAVDGCTFVAEVS